MKQLVFSVYDTKAALYQNPIFVPTSGVAIRAFEDISNDSRSEIAKHPSDYILFQIGEFDDNKGLLVATIPPKNYGLASDYVKRNTNNGLLNSKDVPLEVK